MKEISLKTYIIVLNNIIVDSYNYLTNAQDEVEWLEKEYPKNKGKYEIYYIGGKAK